jgi:hypothetical protein
MVDPGRGVRKAGGGPEENLEIEHMFFAFVPSKTLKLRENGKRKAR